MDARTEARWDHQRDLRKHDPNPYIDRRNAERLAVAALIGECESIAAGGALPEPAEQSLRILIANTLAVFEMPSKAERVPA